MQKLKQTVILSGNGNEVATLKLEKKFGSVQCELKVYNLNADNLILGVNINDVVFKKPVELRGNTYNFKLKDVDNFDNISAILVSKNDDNYNPIMWCKKRNKHDEILAEFNDIYVASDTIDNQVAVASIDEAKLFETDEDEIESIIDNVIDDNIEEIEDVFREENKKLGDVEGKDFFELIADQVEDLFDNYPRVDELEELIPNSKWVKIDFENNGNEYVLGLIYDGFDLKYICYGVPGDKDNMPTHLGNCQWLPLNPKLPSDGYWVIYQDATTGDKVDAI